MKNLLTIIALFATFSVFSQDNATIKNILDNPGKYIDELVEVRGRIEQYIPASTSSTAYYYIKDDFGQLIKVQTSKFGAPETYKKYEVRGYLTEENNDYIIRETDRINLEAQPKAMTSIEPEPISATQHQQEKTPLPIEQNDNLLLYLIIGIAALLLIVVVIALTTRKKTVLQTNPSPPSKNYGPATQPINQINQNNFPEGFSTIKLEPAPKTMRFIPGKFIINSQEDKGKFFQIAGYPSGGDAVITVGREEVRGERSYSHIKIDDKFKTVSRKQAEFVYSNKTLWVINKSEANYTQVDGYELRPNEKKEIKNGSLIRMGELEFKYII
jgi:hypothetical protein